MARGCDRIWLALPQNPGSTAPTSSDSASILTACCHLLRSSSDWLMAQDARSSMTSSRPLASSGMSQGKFSVVSPIARRRSPTAWRALAGISPVKYPAALSLPYFHPLVAKGFSNSVVALPWSSLIFSTSWGLPAKNARDASVRALLKILSSVSSFWASLVKAAIRPERSSASRLFIAA